MSTAGNRANGEGRNVRDAAEESPARGHGGAKGAVIALLLLVPAPSIGVYAAMVAAPGTVGGQAVYALAKVWLLAFPIVWYKLVDRSALAIPPLRRDGLRAGVLSGLLIAAAIIAAYFAIGTRWIDKEFLRTALRDVGFETPAIYLSVALYLTFVNSLLEEYVWRWFVFSRCARIWSLRPAALIAGFLFTVHHIVALQVYFDPLLTAICSLGIWIGGTTWSWIYGRWGNIWAAWISHVFADLAALAIGYALLYG